jgi:hypothetical protein
MAAGVACLILFGAALIGYLAIAGATIQLAAVPGTEGRALGLWMIVNSGLVPIGSLLIGVAADIPAISIRGALDTLEPDRIRHGIRAVEDPGLVRELADRGLVLDVTPVSNVRTGAVRSLEEHPLPELVRAGVRCSVSTDDPVMFDTDLTREYEAVEALGLDPRALYETALAGALCDEATRTRLEEVGNAFAWNGS